MCTTALKKKITENVNYTSIKKRKERSLRQPEYQLLRSTYVNYV